jgi:hypothetical protein
MLSRSFLRVMPGDMSMMLEACFYEINAPARPPVGTMLQMLYYAPLK